MKLAANSFAAPVVPTSMPRFVLTSLGVFALLFSAPDAAGAAELVRASIAPSSAASQTQLPIHGVAPGEASWTDVVSGVQFGGGLHSGRDGAPAAPALHASPTALAQIGGADPARVLPDARAPPA